MQQRYGLILALLLGSAGLLVGQPLPYTTQQRAQIETSRQALEQFRNENYRQAVAKANQLGRPIRITQPDGRIIQLHSITPTGELLYLTTTNNINSSATTRTNALYPGGSLGLNLTGSSASVQNRLGIWDGSRVRNTHVELRGRVTQMDNPGALDSTNENQEHATHVSGTLIAAGVNPLVKGMAYQANLKAWDFNNDVVEATAASTTLLVSNHSYGFQAGWNYNSTRTTTVKWEWLGDTTISQTDDYKFGFYDTDAQNWDRIVVNAPYYLPVRSTGNDHLQDHPAVGESYYLTANGNKLSTTARNYQTGYDQVVLSANAKNLLSVGAIAAIPDGYAQPSDAKLAYFSAWGPTDDGRIKPDIVGVGLSVLSCDNKTDSSYINLQGTSMSSPNIAGSLLLLQEYFSQLNGGKVMRASTLKGLVLHTASEAGTAPGPDYQYGWGLLNTERAARVIGNTDKSNVLDERTINQGETYTLPVVASGKGPLVVTICWTDPEGTVVTASKSTINSRTPKLINDLDVRVADGTTQARMPWTLNPDQPAAAATPGDNIRDNVEQVLIANPVPGKSYTITINHKGTLKNSKQDYALLVSGVGGVLYCASAASTSADSRVDRVQFGSINQAGSAGCTTVTDNTTLTAADVQVNQTLPLSVTVGSCGTARNSIVKAFIDWNLDGVFDPATETVATSGVLTSGGIFTANVVVPATITDGQFTRLRIVQTATEDPAAVTPCGSYAVGETQDYTLHYVRPANDAGVLTLVAPETSFCSQASGASITVQVRNYGTAAQTTIPVSVKIVDPTGNVVATLTGGSIPVAAFSDVNVSLPIPASVVLQPGQSYSFVITTALPGDLIGTNNQLTQVRTTAPVPVAGTLSALVCGTDGAVTLSNLGGTATAYWYDAPSGGNLLAAGNQVTTPVRPANNVYYVGLNDFSGRLGPAAKSDFGGGSYSGNFGPYPLITTKVPVVLKSARLYTGNAGRLTFTVRKYDGTAVSAVSLDVSATRTLPQSATISNGQLADDPNDPGAEYPLNLSIPQPGNYLITIEYSGGVSIFRSNTAVTGFPYSLSGVISTRGSLYANAATGTVDTLTSAWYYFYNLQVGALGCTGLQRTAVTGTTGTPPTASITASGSTSLCQGSAVALSAVTSASGAAYQWLLNGQPITGATASVYQVTKSGNYSVQILGTCPATSSAVTVSINAPVLPTITQNGLVLISNVTGNNQWLLNGVPITGATSSTYTVSQTGRYSVRGSVSGCGESVSDEVYVTILATEPVVADDLFHIYPNPASKLITIEAAAGTGSVPTLQLIDVRGALLQTAPMQLSGKIVTATVDVSALPGGTFFVRLQGDPNEAVRVKRFSKQ